MRWGDVYKATWWAPHKLVKLHMMWYNVVFLTTVVGKSPTSMFQSAPKRTDRVTPRRMHFSLLPLFKTVWLCYYYCYYYYLGISVTQHTSAHKKHRTHSMIYAASRPCFALRHWLRWGKVPHHIWTCMNESDGIKAHSQQATHSASRVRRFLPPTSSK